MTLSWVCLQKTSLYPGLCVPLVFNNCFVAETKNHIEVRVHYRLTFNEHVDNVFPKSNRGISRILTLQRFLPNAPFMTIREVICLRAPPMVI